MSYSSPSLPHPAKAAATRLSFRSFILALLLTLLGSPHVASAVDKGKSAPPIDLEPIEGTMDTVEFHIGSPLFLRMRVNAGRGCEPFNGRPFFFDANGAQVGWGFEEVADSLLLPRADGSCERYLMLSSEHSNLLAEGYYTLSVALLLDEKSELRSDTIVLHPVHSTGADQLSYSRFLLEQMLSNSPLLQDPLTLNELFSEHLPHSPASEVYHAVIRYMGGDFGRAARLLEEARALADETGTPMWPSAAAVSRELEARLAELSN